MGVLGLWEILEQVGHPIKVDALEGKVLGVDANIWLYKFIKGFREKDNATYSIESHKLGLFNRICKLLFYKIKPVFVFDGPAPILKRRTLERRQNVRHKHLDKVRQTAMKALALQLKSQYPNANIDQIKIQMPDLKSNNLVAAEKLTEEDFQLFYLPPNIRNEKHTTTSSQDSTSSDEDDIIYEETFQKYGHSSVDIHSKDFEQLPPEIRYEILHDIKDSKKRIRNVEALPEDSSSFSDFQLERLKARRQIQEKIEKCERDICSTYTGELSDGKLVKAYRVQSDATSTLVYGTTAPILSTVASSQEKEKVVKFESDICSDNTDQMSQSDDIIYEETFPKHGHSRVDMHSKDFEQLPLDIGHEILHVIKDSGERVGDVEALSEDSSSFSDSQLERLEERGPISEQVEKCERDICSSNIGELSDEKLVKAYRVQSDATSTFVCETTGLDSSTVAPSQEKEVVKSENDICSDNTDEMSQSDDIIYEGTFQPHCHSRVDTHSKNFEQLPLDIRHEILHDIKDSGERVGDVEALSEDSSSFSDSQLERLEERGPISEQVEKCERDICSSNIGELSDEKLVKAYRVQSDATSTFVCETTGLDSRTVATAQEKEVVKSENDICSDNTGKVFELGNIPEKNETIMTAQRTNKVTSKIIEDAKELLRLFGIPYIDAAGEAEAQCAKLEELSLTAGTITEDSDIWLFGANNVYRHFFNDDKYVSQYKMNDIEFHIRMTRENLICFAMLVGSDYTDGVMSIGPVTAIEILSEFQGDGLEPLIKFRDWQQQALSDKKLIGKKELKKLLKYRLPQDFPSRAVFDGYTRPIADLSTDQFSWGTPELDELREYAYKNFGWDQRKADDKLLPVMKKMNEKKLQRTIDSFFFETQANRNPEMFRSKRVNQALNKIAKRAARGDKVAVAAPIEVVNLSDDED